MIRESLLEIGMPQIIKVDGVYKLPDDVLDKPNNSRFDYIFKKGIWEGSTGGESVSGLGRVLSKILCFIETNWSNL